jgi:hypothetical protein
MGDYRVGIKNGDTSQLRSTKFRPRKVKRVFSCLAFEKPGIICLEKMAVYLVNDNDSLRAGFAEKLDLPAVICPDRSRNGYHVIERLTSLSKWRVIYFVSIR